MAERDAKGRFLKGHKNVSTGRPRGRPQYLDMLKTALTPTAWRAIIKKAIEDAKDGDAKARAWLSDYALGKPIQPIEVEGQLNVMTLELWKEMAAERMEEHD